MLRMWVIAAEGYSGCSVTLLFSLQEKPMEKNDTFRTKGDAIHLL